MHQERYEDLASYGYISDCHTGALVSRCGSVDWCCLPRYDSGACFARLLDADRGGHCVIRPAMDDFQVTRQYVGSSMVLETTFETAGGTVRLTDAFTMREGGRENPWHQMLRVVEGIDGHVDVVLRVAPRFDYGGLRPMIREVSEGVFAFIGGDDGLVVTGDVPLERHDHHDLGADITVSAGDRLCLSLQFMPPSHIDWEPPAAFEAGELDRRLEWTLEWWARWAEGVEYDGPYAAEVRRSAAVLKGLTYAPSGAMIAAATTSLPEKTDGTGNWDYRFTWVRDSVFAVRSLAELGGAERDEAEAFRRFVERSAAAQVDQLQVLFGIEGEHFRRLHEIELHWLEGWRGAKPVRVGNAAAWQLQHDTIGDLLQLAWLWAERGHSPSDAYCEFLVSMVDVVCDRWEEPDHGIWEFRGDPEHYVHSKVKSWSAVDYGLRLAERFGFEGVDLERWRASRDAIRESIEENGYDADRGVFRQAYGSGDLDAALLLIPETDFIDHDDPRMVRTVDAIMDELGIGHLVRRFKTPEGEAEEGAFVAACFWLFECLLHQDRREEAERVLSATLNAANDVGLYSEMYDEDRGAMRGNLPQALSHLALIAAIMALRDENGSAEGGQLTLRAELTTSKTERERLN